MSGWLVAVLALASCGVGMVVGAYVAMWRAEQHR